MANRNAGAVCSSADSNTEAVMRKGTIATFYSYKGGVGRTQALANIAVLLSRWGYRVLCVDWDLEAPGLHLLFRRLVE
jgi:Mrp family chromosome partitioning ATPase